MEYKNMQDKKVLGQQYKDSEKLDVRKNFHQNYSTNPITYDDWILSKIHFPRGCHPLGCRILEVGCGTGQLWKNQGELIDSFSELVLSDISVGMVEQAKENHLAKKNITCQVIDTQEIPYPENSFDLIIANSMLYHIPHLKQALKEIHRVLKSDGIFYATTASGSEGLMNDITGALYEMGLSETKSTAELSFSLENGGEMLNHYFTSVERELYEDHLEITNANDIVEYIYSMSFMYNKLDASHFYELLAYFEKRKDDLGIIKIPKLYGMFIASK